MTFLTTVGRSTTELHETRGSSSEQNFQLSQSLKQEILVAVYLPKVTEKSESKLKVTKYIMR